MVKVRKNGELLVEYSVDLDNPESQYSCGFFGDMKGSCYPLYAAFLSVNKLSLLITICDKSWTMVGYQRAYDPLVIISPCVTKDELTLSEKHHPLMVPKNRGRSKKSKRSSPRLPQKLWRRSASTIALFTVTTATTSAHGKGQCDNSKYFPYLYINIRLFGTFFLFLQFYPWNIRFGIIKLLVKIYFIFLESGMKS